MTDSGSTVGLPEWADAECSRDLPSLRKKGEGQYLEYMQAYPSQARDLAKEMAAFATAGGGLILIGIDDSGGLVGLSDVNEMSARDSYLNRIQGLAHGKVDPPITPKVGFACEGQHAVLFVRVHKGSQPVYLAAFFERQAPEIVGNDFLVIGTVDRADWKRGAKGSATTEDMMERLHDFQDVLHFKLAPYWMPPK